MNLTRDGAALLPLAEKVLAAQSDFRNAAARLRIDGKARGVADNAEGIGYEITAGGKRRTLSPADRPVCDA